MPSTPRALARPSLVAARIALTAPLLAGLFAVAAPRVAHAQAVSDSDRAAARELYIDGVKLQEQGKFRDALDRFQRAQAVFSAPTHLLHIAECQAALGHLVEAAETYRTLVRTPLPANAPHAFVQAQQQGNAELTQVEPRIAGLKLHVKPENAQGLSVQIDGQPMSAALVGVSRPINPGEHTVTVFAPGYGKSEQRVVLREKEQKELTMTLPPTSGVVYAPATQGGTSGAASGGPSGQTGQAQQPPPPAPPPYGEERPAEPPATYPAPTERRRGHPFSFLVGPRLGLLVPSGHFGVVDANGTSAALSDIFSVGADFGLEAGFRFARVFYLGLAYDHGAHAKGGAIDSSAPPGTTITASTATNYFGLAFAWISNPDGVGFWGELGVGYRWVSPSIRLETVGESANFQQLDVTWGGGEASLAAGVHIRLGQAFRLVPKISIGGGSFTSFDRTCTSGGSASCVGLGDVSGASVTSTESHAFVFVGAVGYFDIGKHGP